MSYTDGQPLKKKMFPTSKNLYEVGVGNYNMIIYIYIALYELHVKSFVFFMVLRAPGTCNIISYSDCKHWVVLCSLPLFRPTSSRRLGVEPTKPTRPPTLTGTNQVTQTGTHGTVQLPAFQAQLVTCTCILCLLAPQENPSLTAQPRPMAGAQA